jgi:uncharacterized protein
MSLPAALAGLLDAAAYPHRSTPPELIETHISWVVLTGTFAYKIKKPVHFDFVDFSTLARREHFCREELRCNRAFAPDLYLDVVPITRDADDSVRVDGEGETVEWAVRMRQFPRDRQLDALLSRGAVTIEAMQGFGAALARRHARAPAQVCAPEELERRVLQPVWDNFDALLAVPSMAAHGQLLARVRRRSADLAERLQPLLQQRLTGGWVRECHGDLHLGNLVQLEDSITAFDCLEFNPDLRWIDPYSDVAFLFMDCLVRGRDDLGHAFVDGYLDSSGDYVGARLLTFYAAYRAMVRAKVAALREAQADAVPARPDALDYVRWAASRLERAPGMLVLMCGLSGSGKSYLAARLAPRLPAVRLRSDVARKTLAGLAPEVSAAAAVGEGLYTSERSDAVYAQLADLADDLLRAGEHVIVDATFLDAARRRRFLARAEALGRPGVVLWCDAPVALLRQRIIDRAAGGPQASDADLAVLARQQTQFEAPSGRVIRIDTSAPLSDQALASLGARIAATSVAP